MMSAKISGGRVRRTFLAAFAASLAGFAAFVAPTTAVGQDVTGGIAGSVVDPAGNALGFATIGVSSLVLPGGRTVATDARGGFRIAALPAGAYRLEIRALGYRGLVYEDLRVHPGETATLPDAVLEVAAVPIEPLVVEARRALLDLTRTAISSTLSAAELERLPSGRDYASFLALLPHANESPHGDPINIAGATGLENAVFVDGVQVTDLYRGRTSTSLPFDMVEAVQVVQGGYAAEYGQALGGIVNVVTRRGSARPSAAAFGAWTGDALAADARPVPGVTGRDAASAYDAGLRLAGPLFSGVLRASLAYDVAVARADIALSGLGPEEERSTSHRFSTRLDWRPAPEWDLAVSVFGDPSDKRVVSPPSGTVRLVNPDPILSRHREGGTNASVHATRTSPSGLLLEASVARHGGREDIEPATALGRAEPARIDRTDAPRIVLSGGNAADQRIRSARTSARLSVERPVGTHRLKSGLEFQDNRLDVRHAEDPGQIIRTAADRWEAVTFLQDVTVRNRVLSAYVQDSWDATRSLTVNAGLRWDGQFLIDQTGAVGQRLIDQVQPRFGLVYRPGGSGRDKVFAHAGRFYQQLPLYWSTLALAGFDQRIEFFSMDPVDGGAPDSATVFARAGEIRGGVDGLDGEYHDEFVVGYERAVGEATSVSVRGIRRDLGRSVTSAFRPDRTFSGGNPGYGPLDHLPPSRREYTAFEATARHRGQRVSGLASYVWSRNEGNYPGLLAADAGGLRGGSFGPNNDMGSYFPVQAANAAGPLPNDRPHVFKAFASADAWSGLGIGASLVVSSGTPVSEFGRVPGGFNTPLFLAPRGSEGRTPTVWDLGVRVRYGFGGAGATRPFGSSTPRAPRAILVVDFLHIGNPQAAVRIDQRRYNAARGSAFASYEDVVANQVGERDAFGSEIGFQEPFQVRVAVEVGIR